MVAGEIEATEDELVEEERRLKEREEQEELERLSTTRLGLSPIRGGVDQTTADFGAEYDITAGGLEQYIEPLADISGPSTTAQFDDQPVMEEQELDTWTGRSVKMLRFLDKSFKTAGKKELSLLEMVSGKNKRVVAGVFFEFLVLKTKNQINLEQEEPYGDIMVTKTVTCFVPFLSPLSLSISCVPYSPFSSSSTGQVYAKLNTQ